MKKDLLDASEDLSVGEDESCDRKDAGEDKSAPVLVIAEQFHNSSLRLENLILTEYNLDSS